MKKILQSLKKRFNKNKSDLPCQKKDQELMGELVSEGEEHLNKLKNIDQKLFAIQKSTKTTFSFFAPIHNYCRTKYNWYYSWHVKPYATKVHYSALALILLSSALFFTYPLLGRPNFAKAATDYTCTWDGSTANWSTDHWGASCGSRVGADIYPGYDVTKTYEVIIASGTVTMDVDSNITGGGTAFGSVVLGTSSGTLSTNGHALTVLNMTIGTGGRITTTSTETITAKGNWNHSAGTFTYGTSTVSMTGSGTITTGGNSKPFNKLQINASGSYTIASEYTTLNTLQLTAGAVTGASFFLQCNQSSANCYVNDGLTITNSTTMIYLILSGTTSGTPTLIPGGNYPRVDFSEETNGSSGSRVERFGKIMGDITFGNGSASSQVNISDAIYLYGRSTIDTNGYNFTAWGGVYVGQSATSRNGYLNITGASIVDLKGLVNIYANDGVTPNIIKTSADSQLKIGGNYANSGTLDMSSGGIVNFTKSSGTQTLTSGGTGTGKLFNNLTHSGAGILSITTNDLDINGLLTLSGGDFAPAAGINVTVAGGLTISGDTTTFTRSSGTLTFDGTGTWTDSRTTKQDLGTIYVDGASTTLTLGSTVKATKVIVQNSGTLNLGAVSTSYTLELTGTGQTTSQPLYINGGTFNKGSGTSTVLYSGSGAATDVATVAYHHLTFTPNPSVATSYNLTGSLTSGNAMSGDLNINANATLNTYINPTSYDLSCVNLTVGTSGVLYAGVNGTSGTSTITVSGNWTNAGTFTYGTSTVNMTGAAATLDGGGDTAAKAFYNLNFVTAGQTVTINTNHVRMYGTLTVGSTSGAKVTVNSVTAGKYIYLRANGTPVTLQGTYNGVAGGYNIDYLSLIYQPSGATSMQGGNYGQIIHYSDYTMTMLGEVTMFYSLSLYSQSAGATSTFDTSTYNFTTGVNGGLDIGTAGNTQHGIFKANSNTITINANLTIYDSDGSGGTLYNKLTADTATIKVAGNYLNQPDSGTPTYAGQLVFSGDTIMEFTKASGTQTLASGGTSVSGYQAFKSLTHSGTGTLQLLTNNINIDGNFTNSAGTFDTNGLDMTVAGNVDLTTGSFTQGTRTMTLDGSGAQSFTAGGTGAGHTPYNLTITNSNASGVTFMDSLSLAYSGTLTDSTGDSHITFHSGSTYTIPTLVMNGASGHNIIVRSSSAGSTAALNVTNAPTLTYVDAKDSNAAGGALITANTSNDSGNNTNWSFGGGVTYISGTAYTNENKSTNVGAGISIALSVNGGAKNTTTTIAGGVFSFNSVGVAANNTLTFFIDDVTYKGNLITQVLNTTNDITGLEMYTGDISLRHETAGPMTNTLLATAATLADANMFFSVASSNATFIKKLWVESGFNYTPGGAVVTTDFEDRGTATFSPGANAVSVSGSWTFSATGTFTTSGTVTMNSTATGKTITTNTKSFSGLTFDGSGGGWTLQDALTASGAITLTTGSLEPNGKTITATGDFIQNVAITSADNITINGANITLGPISITVASKNLTVTPTGNITINGNLSTTSGNISLYYPNAKNLTQNSGTISTTSGSVNFTKTSLSTPATSGTITIGPVNSGGTVTVSSGYSLVINGSIAAVSSIFLEPDAGGTTINADITSTNGRIEIVGLNATGPITHNSGTILTTTGASASYVYFYGTSITANTIQAKTYVYLIGSSNGNITTNGNITAGTYVAIIPGSTTGTFTQAAGTTIASAASSDITIYSEGNATFKNISSARDLLLYKKTTSTTYDCGSSTITAARNLTINSGVTLNGSSANINVGGNWTNSGAFTAGSSTVNFTASSPTTQTIQSSSNAFNVISHSSTGTIQLSDAMTVKDLNITNGTLDANGQNISVSGNWNFSGGTFSAGSTPGSQTVNIIGTTETIFSGNTTFNILKIDTTNYGAKSVKFTASSNQTIPNSGSLTLTGATGKTLTLDRSGGSGSDQWTLTLPTNLAGNIFTCGTNITVSNSKAVNATVTPSNYVTVIAGAGGNNTGWHFDTTSPLITFTANPTTPNGTNSWYKTTDPTVTITADDQSESGVASIWYRWGSSGDYATYSTALTAPVGTNTLYSYAIDNAGHSGVASPSSQEYKVDIVAPVVDISASPSTPNGTNSYYKTTAPAVTLSSTDVTSGASTIYYKWDSGSYAAYSSALTPSDGTHTIYYYGVDNAGNESAVVNREYKVDVVKPTNTFSISPATATTADGWYKDDPLITISATDASAGIASISYQWNNGSVLTYSTPISAPEGDNTLTYYSTDNAGNQSTIGAEEVKYDATAPAISTITPKPSVNPTNSTNITLNWAISSDSASGLSGYLVYIGTASGKTDVLNGTSVSTNTITTKIGTTGTYYLRIKAVDNVGNVSDFSTESTVVVDLTSPVISITELEDNQYITSQSYGIKGTSSDPASGVNYVELQFEGKGDWSRATSSDNYATWSYDWRSYSEGVHTIIAKAIDKTGNTTATREYSVIVDYNAPTLPKDFRVFNVSNGTANVYIAYLDFATSSDDISGLKTYEVYRDGAKTAEIKPDKTQNNQNYTGNLNQPYFYLDPNLSAKKYEYKVKVFDNAGNAAETSSVAIDLTGQKTGIENDDISNLKGTPSTIATKNKTTAIVSWNTTYPATSLVEYGESNLYGKKTDLEESLNQGHSILLSDLKPGTTYHAKVTSRDIYGKELKSQDLSFTTKTAPDDQSVLKVIIETLQGLFRIFSSTKAADSSSGTINGVTLESLQGFSNNLLVTDVSFKEKSLYQNMLTFPKGSKVEKSTDGKNYTTVNTNGNSYYLDKELTAGTSYSYRIDNGIPVTKKPAAGDDSPLTISDAGVIKESTFVAKDKVQITVSWKTNRGGSSQVEFGSSTSYGQKTKEDISLNMGHSVRLEDLDSNTTYHFRTFSKDAKGNLAESPDFTFQTPSIQQDKSPIEVIIESLQKLFSFLSKRI